MPTTNGTICWIIKRPKALEQQHFLSIRQVLQHHGYEIFWLDLLPANAIANLQSWLAEKIPANTQAIIYGDKDLKAYGGVARSLRSANDIRLKNIPLFWVYEDIDHQLLEQLVEVGVDDFFHVSHKPDDLLSRLRLRVHESQNRASQELRWQEQAVKNAKAETILKQREEFLSVCAHDLRSPLGLIQSSITMAMGTGHTKDALSPFQTELLTRAKRQAGHAITLVNDLLDVMSFEQGWKPHYQVLALDDLLSEMHADFGFQAEQKKVKLHYENPVKNWRIVADAERVRQLFQNLFTNALKFTDEGKNIYLRVSQFQGRRKSDPPFPMIIISLKDEGKGMPEKEMQKIFDRFAQIKDYGRSEGRGLGLSVAKQISNLHDGNIWVESTEGKGSTFHVLFPHTVSRTLPQETENEPSILVVEPKDENRKKYYTELAEWGFKVHFARDGVEAVTFAFFYMPSAIILSPNLTKLPEKDVTALLKSDVLTSLIPLILAVDDDKSFTAGVASNIFNRVLKHPLKKEVFQELLAKGREKEKDVHPPKKVNKAA